MTPPNRLRDPHDPRTLSRRRLLTAAALAGGLLLAGGVYGQAPAPADPGKPSPLDEPLRLIAAARAAYRGVRDYTCVVTKREQIDGKLSPSTTMTLGVRVNPFAVRLRWVAPAELKGQDAFYVAGANDGKISVRPAGLLAAVGFVLIDPDDARVRRMSRHSITEAGIGSVIERFGAGWERERALNLTAARTGVYEFDKRRCTRVETTHPVNPGKVFLHYRNVVYFDQATGLPLRVEGYDWPDAAGQSELVEVYSFVNLKLNVGLTDAAFRQ